MAAATVAVDVLRSNGARNKTRLIALVKHYCAFYGEDEESEVYYALDLARRIVLNFDDDFEPGRAFHQPTRCSMYDYQREEIRAAHDAALAAPGYAKRCAEAAIKGFRPATIDECLYCDAEDIYRWRGALWCRSDGRAA